MAKIIITFIAVFLMMPTAMAQDTNVAQVRDFFTNTNSVFRTNSLDAVTDGFQQYNNFRTGGVSYNQQLQSSRPNDGPKIISIYEGSSNINMRNALNAGVLGTTASSYGRGIFVNE